MSAAVNLSRYNREVRIKQYAYSEYLHSVCYMSKKMREWHFFWKAEVSCLQFPLALMVFGYYIYSPGA